ncbi:hypothetical protein LSUE1_G008205, partial [Lachnellula suecica]
MSTKGGTHDPGLTALIPSHTIATFPTGTFLENLAVRPNGTLLLSSMNTGEIFFLDPHHASPQSTVLLLHSFNAASSQEPVSTSESAYGNSYTAEALVEDPNTPDVFYTFSGIHTRPNTWSIFSLDLRNFSPSDPTRITVTKVAPVPTATWLNGGTMLPSGILLIAESNQGQILSYNLNTRTLGVWLDHDLLGRVTGRPEWPGVNGLQYFRGSVFATVSDRAILVKMAVTPDGAYEEGSLEVVAEDITGDDLAFDERGNVYVATNPAQSVMKLSGIGGGKLGLRETVIGGEGVAETAGPTAVAFGRGVDAESIYVTTTGGL